MYSENQVDKLYEYLRGYENVESAEIGWRQARAACDKAKHCDRKSEERKSLMHEGFKYAERSMAIDDKCGPCHRVSHTIVLRPCHTVVKNPLQARRDAVKCGYLQQSAVK